MTTKERIAKLHELGSAQPSHLDPIQGLSHLVPFASMNDFQFSQDKWSHG